MSLKCMLGFHDWKGCTCNKCGRTRLNGREQEKCLRCGILPIGIATLQNLNNVRYCLDVNYVLIANCAKRGKCERGTERGITRSPMDCLPVAVVVAKQEWIIINVGGLQPRFPEKNFIQIGITARIT